MASQSAAAPVTPPTLLKVEALRFGYPQQQTLFSDWSAQMPAGLTLVTGDESCGKTTLLRLLAGVLPAQGGRLQANGLWLDEQPQAYRQQVFWADPRLDALDQVSAAAYFTSLQTAWPRFDPRMLGPLIAGFTLAEHIDKPMYMLSTGSRRKVWLAAAFASGAPAVLLDDPFAALDRPSIAFAMEQLSDAARWADRACVIAHYEALGKLPLAATIMLGG